jgi:predicted transcriptional regulator
MQVKVFGSLEAQIMPIMWREERITVKQVHREIVKQRDIAYTTVMTTMVRLAEKGLLHRERDGQAYTYWPALSRQEYAQLAVMQVIGEVLEGDGSCLAEVLNA